MKTTTSAPRQTTTKITQPHRNIDYSKIKQMWLEGKTKSYIKRKLKLAFETVENALIAMGIDKERASRKLPSINPIKGRIEMKVPGVKGTFYVRPQNMERFKERYGIS